MRLGHQVCEGPEGTLKKSIQHTKELGGEREAASSPCTTQQICFPGPCSDVNSETRRMEERAMEMVASSRSPKKLEQEDFAKIGHPSALTLNWEQQG